MSSSFLIPSKLAAEDIIITTDFANLMVQGTTISSAAVTAVVYSGVDPAPNNIISGSATISGGEVSQKIIDGEEGCTYLLTFSATTSDAQIIRKQAFLTIIPATGI